jgi:hypothetical protein
MKDEDRKKLEAYLKQEAFLADKSYHEWNQAYPNCTEAAYRSGMWFAFHEVENFLARIPKYGKLSNNSPQVKHD